MYCIKKFKKKLKRSKQILKFTIMQDKNGP
jgi:hypothetical protein